MNKADKVCSYLKANPTASAATISRALGISYSYTYKVMRGEEVKKATAEAVAKHVKEVTQPSMPEPSLWERVISKVLRLLGTSAEKTK